MRLLDRLGDVLIEPPVVEGDCAEIGHEWQEIWAPRNNEKGAPALVCRRCKENGWKV